MSLPDLSNLSNDSIFTKKSPAFPTQPSVVDAKVASYLFVDRLESE